MESIIRNNRIFYNYYKSYTIQILKKIDINNIDYFNLDLDTTNFFYNLLFKKQQIMLIDYLYYYKKNIILQIIDNLKI